MVRLDEIYMIKNDSVRKRVRVALIIQKMVENKFRWFGHVAIKLEDVIVRSLDQMGSDQKR